MLFYYNYNLQERKRFKKQQLLIYIRDIWTDCNRPAGTLRLSGRPAGKFSPPGAFSHTVKAQLEVNSRYSDCPLSGLTRDTSLCLI